MSPEALILIGYGLVLLVAVVGDGWVHAKDRQEQRLKQEAETAIQDAFLAAKWTPARNELEQLDRDVEFATGRLAADLEFQMFRPIGPW